MSLQLLSRQHIDDWACGVADAKAIALVEEALKDPDSQASRYCDWLRNPAKYVGEHGTPPELVVHQLSTLSTETIGKLKAINDDLPPELHVGNILSVQGIAGRDGVKDHAYKRLARRILILIASALAVEHAAAGLWLARLLQREGMHRPVTPVPEPVAKLPKPAQKPAADSADVTRLIGYMKAMKIADGSFAGGYRLAPASPNLNWYFNNVGLLPLASRRPEAVRAYLDLYLANVDRSTFLIEDVANIADGRRQRSDSDASYAASMLSLAWIYYRNSQDNEWLRQNTGLFKNIARRVIVGSQTPSGLCRGFLVNPAESPCQLMDNCEIYRGMANFGALLNRVGDADAPEFEAAANRVAAGVASLYDEKEQRFHSSDTGEGTKFYPVKAAQIFPELFGVPLGGELVTRRRYAAAWAFLNADGDRWEAGEVSDESLQGFPWMLLGCVAAKRGEGELARRQLRYFLSKVDAGWPFQSLHECGWAIQTLDLLASTAPAP